MNTTRHLSLIIYMGKSWIRLPDKCHVFNEGESERDWDDMGCIFYGEVGL